MKKGHRRLLVFEILVFLIFFINSFISNILGEYNTVIFLFLLLVLFKFVFGFEKDRNRFAKDVMFEIMIFLVIFFVLFYILGIFIGFAKTNYLNWYGFKTFIIPLGLTIILKEVLRYMMLKKSEGSKFMFVSAVILFIFLDVTDAIYYNSFDSSYNSFVFFALSLLPAISANVVCSLLSVQSGYKPVMLYLLIIELYNYLLPLIPNPNEYILSLILFMAPIFMYYKVKSFLVKYKDREVERDYGKKNFASLIVPSALAVIVVYFTSGYFGHQAMAIASGSMSPKIEKGDIVIINKLEEGDHKNLKVDEIIAFEHRGVVVVHRIINIKKVGEEYFFYTKGDANASADAYSLSEKEIIGTVSIRIPFVGLPTVWLNEM